MSVARGTLAQNIDGRVQYIYPKTEADLVEYENGISIKNKIEELDDIYCNTEIITKLKPCIKSGIYIIKGNELRVESELKNDQNKPHFSFNLAVSNNKDNRWYVYIATPEGITVNDKFDSSVTIIGTGNYIYSELGERTFVEYLCHYDGTSDIPTVSYDIISGKSPFSIETTEIENGHRITITTPNGSESFNVLNGEVSNGSNGFSPIVEVTEIENGHKVTITDASGAKTFNVLNGAQGTSGDSTDGGSNVSKEDIDNILKNMLFVGTEDEFTEEFGSVDNAPSGLVWFVLND